MKREPMQDTGLVVEVLDNLTGYWTVCNICKMEFKNEHGKSVILKKPDDANFPVIEKAVCEECSTDKNIEKLKKELQAKVDSGFITYG